MPATTGEISEIQVRYILEFHPDAAAYPPQRGGQGGPHEFLYRRRHLLTRDQDLQRVLSVLPTIPVGKGRPPRPGDIDHPIPGLARIELAFEGPDNPDAEALVLFSTLEAIRRELGPDVAGPDHLMSVTQPQPAAHCPAAEPDPVPGQTPPLPAVSRSRCDGRGTRVAVVDTGLVQDAPNDHPWLGGVTGDPDPDVDDGVSIEGYGCHGTFCASIVRAMAPRAEVRVTRMFEEAGVLYESDVVAALIPVLDWAPDVISLSAGTHTWMNGGLLSFKVFVNGPLRECHRTVLVAAAGNDGADWKFSPAEMDGVIGVGALGPGDARASFSDYGDWVKVYAPGQDLVHAFAKGAYRYRERQGNPQAQFDGMASWSGTSFSTPLVAGLIAARMPETGESSREAAESLLRLARAQALPGVGPVLRPGQACLCACERPRGCHEHQCGTPR